VRNQDRFPRVCQVGNGIETLTRFLLRNRLHRIQICATLGRIARGVTMPPAPLRLAEEAWLNSGSA
jgi:hypothetical protein